MSFKFPFTNYHELNLTWVLDQLKKLFEESAENVSTIQNYDGRLTAVETELPSVSETASEASRAAAAAGTLAQTATQKADTAQENAVQAQGLAGTARQEAQAAQTAANQATQAAQQAQATAQNFDGRITQAENDAASALEASRSFENRVQSAITTANNAAQTATNAQGIAMRADQNAGTALDKIGDLSQLTTTAKNNLVVAINEAAQSGGVTSVNGKTGAVVLDAGDIGYNGTTVETALDGKQNAPTAAGTAGQVLGLNSELAPVWINQSGGDCSECAPIIINTASGAVASFSDGADNRQIQKIVGTIMPQQAEGTPSPKNPMPISGWTGANIYSEETYDASATPKLSVNWQTEDDTIYGGVVTLNEDGSVDVTRTYQIKELNGSENPQGNYAVNANTVSRYFLISPTTTINNPTSIPTDADMSILKSNLFQLKLSGVWGVEAENNVWCWTVNNYNQLHLAFSNNALGITTESSSAEVNAAIKAWLSNNHCYFILPLREANYQTYHFDNVGKLYTLLGTNSVWIDTGSINEVQYPADTKLYIDGKLAELQATILENI